MSRESLKWNICPYKNSRYMNRIYVYREYGNSDRHDMMLRVCGWINSFPSFFHIQIAWNRSEIYNKNRKIASNLIRMECEKSQFSLTRKST